MKNQVFVDNINLLIERFGAGKLEKFSRFIGLQSSAVKGWKKGSLPDGVKTLLICEKCGISPQQLFNGKIADINTKQCPVARKSEDYIYSKESPEIEELLDDARYVLTAGNALAFNALERNIKYFRHAVTVESEMKQLRQENADIKEQLNDLQAQFKVFKKERESSDLSNYAGGKRQ